MRKTAKRKLLDNIITEASDLGLPIPGDVLLDIAKDDAKKAVADFKIPPDSMPLFTKTKPGAVPAYKKDELLILSNGGWTPPMMETRVIGMGGGTSTGGGVTDHDLLNNLAYAASGHIGFEPTVTKGNFTATAPLALSAARELIGGAADVSIPAATALVDGYLTAIDFAIFAAKQNALAFPLAANLGGTGIANAVGSTLTLGGATSITTGGTIALGGFTLTVPASLTAAGLAIANVFTESQTIPATSAAATKGLIVADGANKIVNFQGLDAGGNTYSFYGTNRTYGVGGWSATGWYAARKAGVVYVLNDAFYYYRFPASSNTPAAIFSILTAGADPNIRTTAQVENASNGLGAGADVFVKNDASITGGMSMLSSGFSNALYRSRLVFTSQRGISYVSDNLVASGGTYTIDFATGGYSNSVSATINADGSLTLSGRDATAVQLTTIGISTTNNAIKEVSRIRADVSTAATGGAAGFGPAQTFYAETATDTTIQQQAQIASVWTDATNATRKAKLKLSAFDTAERLGMEVVSNGTVAKVNITTSITTPDINFTPSTPSALGGDVNNWDLGGNTFVRSTGGAADRIVTGIVARETGHYMIIANIGTTNKISYANESASSSAANRIITATGSTVEVHALESIFLVYDGVSSRWREVIHA